MVDVSSKAPCKRTAVAAARIILQPHTMKLVQDNQIQKGDVLAVARVAGIQAAKQTATLIPLCHPLPLSHVSVDFRFLANGIGISASASTVAGTGVEMEALTAATVAALTIYDMCKAADKSMHIEAVYLVSKKKEEVK